MANVQRGVLHEGKKRILMAPDYGFEILVRTAFEQNRTSRPAVTRRHGVTDVELLVYKHGVLRYGAVAYEILIGPERADQYQRANCE